MLSGGSCFYSPIASSRKAEGQFITQVGGVHINTGSLFLDTASIV